MHAKLMHINLSVYSGKFMELLTIFWNLR